MSSLLNYSNIVCPVSMQPIADCDCQNCYIARLDADYEKWERERDLKFAVKLFGFCASMLVVSLIYWAVQR